MKRKKKEFVGSGVHHVLSTSSSTSSSSSSSYSLILIKIKYMEIASALCVKRTRENLAQLIQRRVEQQSSSSGGVGSASGGYVLSKSKTGKFNVFVT